MKVDSKKIIINREGRKNSRIEQSQSSFQEIEETYQQQLKKLQIENKYLKNRNEILLTKTESLINIAKKHGQQVQISNEILRQIKTLNDKQQTLEQILLEKSNRFFKLIKVEVQDFMKSIDFEIDINKLNITNESEMLLLLMKLFKERYDQLREEIIMLQKSIKTSKKVITFQEQAMFLEIKKENRQLKEHIEGMAAELEFLQLQLYSINKTAEEKKIFEKYNFDHSIQMYENQINILHNQIKQLKCKILQHSQEPLNYGVINQKLKGAIQQLQENYHLLQRQYQAVSKKLTQLESEQKRFKKKMERIIKQKNDQINMLEKQNAKAQEAISSLRLKDKISQNYKENYDFVNINK